MAPWTVTLSQLIWACQKSVPLWPVMVKLYIKPLPGWIGHCVMYAGPSYHPVRICLAPCLIVIDDDDDPVSKLYVCTLYVA